MTEVLEKVEGLLLQDLRKRFGELEVLKGITLEVKKGEFFTLLGPSGCGKTTLLRLVGGFELPDAGRIVLSGRDLTGLPAHRRPVNTVFQNYALFPHLTVYENVAFGLRSRRFPEAVIRSKVEYALGLVRLESLVHRYPHQLSGGQKQRVALARALVNEPEVLLLDEPMSALDAKLRAEVQVELRNLQRRLGATFILVTHDQEEAMAVSDRIGVMEGGVLLQVGTPDEVYERPRTRFVAPGDAPFQGDKGLVHGTVVAPVKDQDLGPPGDSPGDAQSSAVSVGSRKSELPEREPKALGKLLRHPKGILCGKHGREALQKPGLQFRHHRPRAVPGHGPSVA